nr:PRC-barrel domain-containing protein [Candidatus Njordarchaeum guaymaensis]
MTKFSARRLLKTQILDDQGEKIGRLKDVIVETRTGNIVSLVIDKVDSTVASEVAEKLPTGESVVPISVVTFDEGSVILDRRKLKLLSLKRGLKKKIILAKDSVVRTDI